MARSLEKVPADAVTEKAEGMRAPEDMEWCFDFCDTYCGRLEVAS